MGGGEVVAQSLKGGLLNIDCRWGGSLDYYTAFGGDQLNIILIQPKSPPLPPLGDV